MGLVPDIKDNQALHPSALGEGMSPGDSRRQGRCVCEVCAPPICGWKLLAEKTKFAYFYLMLPILRQRIWFTGHVQGVGFRYTARRVAEGYAVTGLVENLPDGRVLVVAEGEPGEVAAFRAAVEESMANYIKSVSYQDEITPQRTYTGFTIKR
jgi:acylphosphatase